MLTDDYELREIKLNEGDYVRTREGIDQFEYTHKGNYGLVNYKFKSGNDMTNPEYYVLKSSQYLIDVLEPGDYVNGMKVTKVDETYHGRKEMAIYCDDNGDENWQQVLIYDDEIESVVTREQFEEMEFKVNG